MKAALKSAVADIPETRIKAISGSVAVGAATLTLVVVDLCHLSLGASVLYGLLPLGITLAAWLILVLIRLSLVGRLASDAGEDIIPRGLRPWLRGWLLVRFGLAGSGLMLLVLGLAAGIAQPGLLPIVVVAFVDLVWCRIILDAVFHAALNAGLILNRS